MNRNSLAATLHSRKPKSLIYLTVFLSVILGFTSCRQNKPTDISGLSLIPVPNQITPGKGEFRFNEKTRIIVGDPASLSEAQQLAGLFKLSANWDLPVVTGTTDNKNTVFFKLGEMAGNEAYRLNINPQRIEIEASDNKGFFYAVQTLRQLLPKEIELKTGNARVKLSVPSLQIEDSPVFPWRGFMLDVSRHFIPKDDVLKIIDNLAIHKINTFHLHLVDDQGWRIEIKKYPKLTEVGAWRVDHEDKHWNSRPKQQEGEKATYGGFYTQDDIREMVEFAAKRHVTIIPEIEMPAHVTSALAAYPQLSCTGGPFTVLPGGVWPITDIYCAGNDSVFTFIEDVLTEVMELFPSKYIHIGGDEATKTEWEKCPKCLKRKKAEKLHDVGELQSYFIKRIEKFIQSKDRVLLGWDEILEGGLPPKATVMSWRGVQGGIDAAKQGHDVVMTPTTPCYFDYYQGPMDQEPPAIGGNNTLTKVYQFNPVPSGLTSEEAKHILGGQANLWTEYVPNLKHAEYMIFPRIAAMAEALWTKQEVKNWDSFSKRMADFSKRYEIMGINFARSAWKTTAKATCDTLKKQLAVILTSELPGTVIHFTTDGSQVTEKSPVYENPILLDKTTSISAAVVKNGQPAEKTFTREFSINKATVKPVKYLVPYSQNYSGSGSYTLVNGIRGTKDHTDGEWQAWNGQNMEIIIDLQGENSIKSISAGTLRNAGSWIFLPKSAVFFISDDGINFRKIAEVKNGEDPLSGEIMIKDFTASFEPVKGSFVKIVLNTLGKCPKGHSGEGQAAWLFVDEVKIE